MGSVDQLASNPEPLQTSEEQPLCGEDFIDNCNETVNDTVSPQRPAEEQDLSPGAASAMDGINDQFADADETEEVVQYDQPVQSAVEKTFSPKGEATDQYQEPGVVDTVLTKDIEDIHLPQAKAVPSASRDANDARDDLKAVFKADPNQLNDGAAYTSPIREASGEAADKPKVGSETVPIKKSACPIDSATEETISSATQKEKVASQISQSMVQEPGIRQRPARTNNVASTSAKAPQSDLTVRVQNNGKTTRCLVDTGAAVSVLDADHMLELYDG